MKIHSSETRLFKCNFGNGALVVAANVNISTWSRESDVFGDDKWRKKLHKEVYWRPIQTPFELRSDTNLGRENGSLNGVWRNIFWKESFPTKISKPNEAKQPAVRKLVGLCLLSSHWWASTKANPSRTPRQNRNTLSEAAILRGSVNSPIFLLMQWRTKRFIAFFYPSREVINS